MEIAATEPPHVPLHMSAFRASGGALALAPLLRPEKGVVHLISAHRLMRHALHVDGTLVCLHDAVHYRQAQARSLAHALGREEGLEDA